MKLHPTLLATSSLLAILSPSAVRADDGILNFELSQPQWTKTAPTIQEAVATAPAPAPDPANQPLPIPPHGVNPPMRYHSPQQLPSGVYRRAVAVALNDSTSATALLPPAPPPTANPVLTAVAPPDPALKKNEPGSEHSEQVEAKQEAKPLGLDFDVAPSAAVVALAEAKLQAAKPPADPLISLFDGNSDSLVAWAVGSAEGTRTPNGGINPAYSGHTDPGNRAWNMGTFSYQHGAKTPEEADQKQLARLKNQGDVLRRRALKHGLNLTLEETLNGLDLANQSPLAAIGRVGYIERLVEAKANGLEGAEAILVARTRSYINPNTGRWNAPGLGNTEPGIRRDQQRRANAVANAIAAYESQNPQLQAQKWTLVPSPEPASDALVSQADTQPEPVDDFLTMWTASSDPVTQVDPAAPQNLATQTDAAESPDADRKDNGLAALWQITVDRLSQVSSVDGGTDVPQTASLARVMFNPSSAKDSVPVSPDTAVASPAHDSAERSSGSAPEDSQADASEEAPDAIAIPAWEMVREANQASPAQPLKISTAVPSAPLPGAMPTTTVYAPAPLAADPAEPDEVLPHEVSPSDEALSLTPELVIEPGTADPAALETPVDVFDQTSDTPQPTEASGSLRFDSASSADLALEPPAANLPPDLPTPDLSETVLTGPEPTASESPEPELSKPELSKPELSDLESTAAEAAASQPAAQVEAASPPSDAIAASSDQ